MATRRRLTVIAGLSAISLLVVLAGCGLDDWKEEYRGVDLIANRTLSVAGFADSYTTGTSPAFDYVNFEEVTDPALYGATTGLPATPGPIYRLEIVNLMPDGDFEHVVDGDDIGLVDPLWTIDGGTTLEADDAAGLAIDGMSAMFTVSGSQAAYFDLRSGLLDGLVFPGEYSLNLRLRRETTSTQVNFDYGSLTQSFLALNGISWETDPDPANTALDPEDFPNSVNANVPNLFAVGTGVDHYFYIGAPDDAEPVLVQSGHIDDLRIGRMDILPHVSLPLGAATLAGSLEILPGLYRFSVYVKSEIDSQVTPATSNAFRSGQIALGVNDLWSMTSIDDAAWTTTDWVQISFDILIQYNDIVAPEPVVLQMSVTSNQNPAVGRILIASPTFELVVN